MKKLYYLIVLTLILGLVLTGCSLLSNVGQVPTSEQSGISYLTKGIDPTLDLVGLWHFDGNADDSSGNNNSGTEEGGANYASSLMGQALSLNGSSGYVMVPDSNTLDITDKITIEAWINPTTLGSFKYIVSKRLGLVANYGFRLNGGKLEFYYAGSTGWQAWHSDSDVISLGSWQHVAAVFTFGSGSVALYVNGAPVNGSWRLGHDGLEAVITNDHPLRIGALYEGKLLPFDGLIDEVRIWNSVLTADQLMDTTPPVITITTPVDGATYHKDQPVAAMWSTTDGFGTGVAFEGGSVPSGDPIDTSILGMHSFEVTAIDYAKNMATKSVDYNIIQPDIEIVKTASTTVATPLVDTVTYTCIVTNTGNCTLYDVSLLDGVVGPILLVGLTDDC